MYFLERFNRWTVGHFSVVYCGSDCINFRESIQDWVNSNRFNTELCVIKSVHVGIFGTQRRVGGMSATPGSGMGPRIDGNYRVITLIFKKYGNLPLCLENYALCSLPPIFTNILYTYSLRDIIYIGEPSDSITSNYHGTFILICMHWYDPMFKYIYEIVFFLG